MSDGGALEVEVLALAAGNDGIAKVGEKTFFLPGTLPGERVRILPEVLRRLETSVGSRSVQLGFEDIRISVASDDRVRIPCPHFGRCGGCQWLHAGRRFQLARKDDIFHRLLIEKIGLTTSEKILPIASVEPEFGYRRRVTLHAQKGLLGFSHRRSADVIPFDGCLLLMPELEKFAVELFRTCSGKALPKGCSDVGLTADDAGHAVAAFHFAGAPTSKALSQIGSALEKCGLSGGCACVDGRVVQTFGRWILATEAPQCDGRAKLGLRADLFAQAHRQAGEVLAKSVLQWADCAGKDVLELHGGSGTFTFALACNGKASTVTSVESCGAALSLARKSAVEARISNVRYIEGDAVKTALSLGKSGEKFPVLVLDPPRGGAKGIAEGARAVGAEVVVYVSCNPQSLALDAAALVCAGYELIFARGFDLFPQTGHLEAVAAFRRQECP